MTGSKQTSFNIETDARKTFGDVTLLVSIRVSITLMTELGVIYMNTGEHHNRIKKDPDIQSATVNLMMKENLSEKLILLRVSTRLE